MASTGAEAMVSNEMGDLDGDSLRMHKSGRPGKIEIVALNKIDAVAPEALKQQKERLKRAAKKTPLLISGVTRAGVNDALRALVDVIGEAPVSDKAKTAAQAEPWAPPTT